MSRKDIHEIRLAVMTVPKYNGLTWHRRVRNMSDRQVIAIYNKFKEMGMFKKKNDIPEPKRAETEPYHQITMFEYMEACSCET